MATTTAPALRAAKRGLLLRDSVTFLALCGVSVVLFLVTLLIFRSFEDHREELGRRWAQRGRLALQEHHPGQAVAALRTALSYKDALPEQLLLAQALADGGHVEEAMNYFLTLRESRPGDGFLNLQLARLNRQRGDTAQATEYYRASIFGDWQGDGAQRRRDVRFELADYLAEQHKTSAARDELLVAAGNTPESPSVDVLFGDRLEAIGDSADAFLFYKKSIEEKPHQRDTLAKAGRLAYSLGDYSEASKLLTGALAEHATGDASAAQTKQLTALAADARRIPELSLSRELPASERADHLLLASEIAQKRLGTCVLASDFHTPPAATQASSSPTDPPVPPVVPVLRSRWAAIAGQLKRRSLERDAALEDIVTQLINDTEVQTAPVCGPPTGDDALLLMLASSPHPTH